MTAISTSVTWGRIDTVLLDMDGTLLDLSFDNYFWKELVPAHYARARNLEISAAHAVLGPLFAARQGTLDWYCTDFWSRELKLDIARIKHEARARVCFLPGATSFLTAVRASGKRLMLVTNAHPDALRIKASQTALTGYFDAMVSSHLLGYPKEHAGFWDAFIARYVFDPARALFVDDSPRVLEAARQFGIAHVVAISCPDSTLPGRIVDGFSAVRSIADLLPISDP